MYIKRDLEGKIRKYLDAPEIIAVTGARQVGKTTLLKHIQEKLDKLFKPIGCKECIDLQGSAARRTAEPGESTGWMPVSPALSAYHKRLV